MVRWRPSCHTPATVSDRETAVSLEMGDGAMVPERHGESYWWPRCSQGSGAAPQWPVIGRCLDLLSTLCMLQASLGIARGLALSLNAFADPPFNSLAHSCRQIESLRALEAPSELGPQLAHRSSRLRSPPSASLPVWAPPQLSSREPRPSEEQAWRRRRGGRRTRKATPCTP